MVYTLRFVLGFLLVLAICSSSKTASTWRRMKLLSDEQSTLQSTDATSENPHKDGAAKEQEKPKTEETNKIVSDISVKEQEASSLEDKVRNINNDLSKDSTESDRATQVVEAEDVGINIEKYLSEDFHDKNNVYKLPTSPDIEKYVDNASETTPQNTDDKKYETIKNDISKKLEYIDEKFTKNVQHELTTDNETPLPEVKYKNASFAVGNKVRKEEELQTGKSLDQGFSYIQTVSEEQRDTTVSETFFDDTPKTNETEDVKIKAFRAKSTTDPEEVHERLNQTERRTALLSNKIELDNADENRKTKWSFYTPTTPTYTTSAGQKEEVVFVPNTKSSAINISKRGSTKFVDTITTQKPLEPQQTKSLDEAAVENQIFPVQVPAPNDTRQDETVNTSTPITVSTKPFTTQSSTTPLPVVENVTTSESDGVSSSTVETSKSPAVIMSSSLPVTQRPISLIPQTSTLIPQTSSLIPQTPSLIPSTSTLIPQTSSLIPQNVDENNTTTPEKAEQDNVTVTDVHLSSEKEYSTDRDVIKLPVTETTLETTTETSTTNEFVSDQTVPTVIANETKKNVTVESTTRNETESLTTTFDEITTLLPETTLSPLATLSTTQSSTIPIKLDDRTSSSRFLKNLTAEPPIATTEMVTEAIIKHSESTSSTSENVPNNNVRKQEPPVERRLTSETPTSELTSESTTGSSYPEEQQEETGNSGKIAAIVISCIGALCFIILAILWFVMRKRHKRFNYGQRCTPVSLDAYSVDNVSTYNSVRRKGMRASKRSYGNPAFEEASVTHLLNFPELMKFGTNQEGISSEYDDIPQISVQASELPNGCDLKNRYANVIPLPESRVFLSAIDDSPNSDYINANFVTGPKSTKNYYIACQAPMQETVDDFWRMIWEQQTRVVLMLTHLFENGSEKCFDYLPPSEVLDCHRLFGDFQITLNKREVKEKYIISSLQLKNMVANTWRDVTHLWYLGWPERGVPLEENFIVAFLIEARSYVKAAPTLNGKQKESASSASAFSEHNPIVVHCSPGTGRTGTVIACDIAIREFELTRQVDVPKTVYQIRRNRAGAVQTKEQYQFIYRVVTWYANKLTGGVLDSL